MGAVGCAALNPLTPLEVAQLHQKQRELCKEQRCVVLCQSSPIPAFCAESYKLPMKSCLRQEGRFWRTGRFLLRLPRGVLRWAKQTPGCSAQGGPGHVQPCCAGAGTSGRQPREPAVFTAPRHRDRVMGWQEPSAFGKETKERKLKQTQRIV